LQHGVFVVLELYLEGLGIRLVFGVEQSSLPILVVYIPEILEICGEEIEYPPRQRQHGQIKE